MLHIQSAGNRLSIARPDGSLLAVQNAAADHRPYLHPLMAPDLLGAVTEDAPAHHPWQHGLYLGLNDVNGVGFWTEGLFPKYRAIDGSVVSTKLEPAAGSGETGGSAQASWQVASSWRGLDGAVILNDWQHWRMRDAGACYWLDLAWTITAAVDVRFGKYAYGGLFLRMPFSAEAQAVLLTSEQATTPEQAEGKRARWVATALVPPERRGLTGDTRFACVTLMDHPGNPEHPTPWRVDGQYGIGPSRCAAGAWALTRGQSVVFRHRALITIGRPQAAMIEDSYRPFAETAS